VIVGGVVQKSGVTDKQVTLWAAGITGFITLQWLL
jgi:hypothetical protein